MKIGIITDSTISRTDKVNNCQYLAQIPLTVTIGDKEYKSSDVSLEEFFKTVDETHKMPKTSQPSTQIIIDTYDEMTEKFDKVICILISKQVSGTFQNARIALESAKEPEKIKLIDCGGAGMIETIVVEKTMDMIENNENFEQIIEKVEKIASKCKLMGCPEVLDYLAYGGRVPLPAAKIGGFLGIKIGITMENFEKPKIGLKSRSNKGMIKKLKQMLIEEKVDKVYFCDILMNKELKESYVKMIEELKIKIVYCIGEPVSVAHFGAGSIALGWIKNN